MANFSDSHLGWLTLEERSWNDLHSAVVPDRSWFSAASAVQPWRTGHAVVHINAPPARIVTSLLTIGIFMGPKTSAAVATILWGFTYVVSTTLLPHNPLLVAAVRALGGAFALWKSVV